MRVNITNTVDLAKKLMAKLGMTAKEFARPMRISAPAITMAMKPRKTGRRNTFHTRVIALGLRHGLESDALSILFECSPDDIASIQIAAFMYPDLRAYELGALRGAEQIRGRLSSEEIREIVGTLRTPSEQPVLLPNAA